MSLKTKLLYIQGELVKWYTPNFSEFRGVNIQQNLLKRTLCMIEYCQKWTNSLVPMKKYYTTRSVTTKTCLKRHFPLVPSDFALARFIVYISWEKKLYPVRKGILATPLVIFINDIQRNKCEEVNLQLIFVTGAYICNS